MNKTTHNDIAAKTEELLALCHKYNYKAFVGIVGPISKPLDAESTLLLLKSEGNYAQVHWLFAAVLHEQALKTGVEFGELLEHFTDAANETDKMIGDLVMDAMKVSEV